MSDDNVSTEPHIIKEYKDVYFIFKPPFWNCVTGHDYEKIKNHKNLILNWIKKNIKINDELNNQEKSFGLLNRLDIETSGIIMVAKDMTSYEKYRNNINNHILTTKIYIALVEGDTEHEFGVISTNLLYDRKLRRTSINSKHGKFSYTEYVKIKTLSFNEKTYSLLMVKIKTGRTHQIRVHLSSIGHKIFCDKKYQENKKILENECNLSKRLFLHAMYYKIEKDTFGFVKIPEDLSNTLDKMKTTENFISTDNAFDLLYSNSLTNNILDKLQKKK